jgi:hypothetical protein
MYTCRILKVVLCAGVAGAGVLPELRRFFRRRSRSRILYAGAGVTFSQLRQNDNKTIEMRQMSNDC